MGGPAERESSRPRSALVALGGLAVLFGAVVYLNGLANPFVYDDEITVVGNASIRHLVNWRYVLLGHQFRPLTNLTYALDYALWGLRPFGFHLTGLAFHLINVALVYRLGLSVVRDRQPEGGRPGQPPRGAVAADSAIAVAFLAAALFAVHPMQTEAVGYVSGRSDVLSATGFMLALFAFRRVLLGNWTWLVPGLALYVLACGAKEVAIGLPLVLLAYDRLIVADSAAAARARFWRLHAPLLGLLTVAGIIRAAIFVRLDQQPFAVPVWQYLLIELIVVWRYLALLLVPASQSIVHSVHVVGMPLDPMALLAASGLLLLGLAAWRSRHRAPLAAFGLVWFLVLLAPSSSILPLNQAMAEHRTYLANWGVFLALAVGATRLRVWPVGAPLVPSRVVQYTVVACLLVALSLLTLNRNVIWGEPERLWREATIRAPDMWFSHYALGASLSEAGNCRDAIPSFERARTLAPTVVMVHTDLGLCLMGLGRLDEARPALEAALRAAPGLPRAHNNLGVLALRQGDPGEAETHFQEALALDAKNLVARRNLAALYETVYDDPAQALRLCREIRTLEPSAAGVEECIRRNAAKLPLGASS
jgi:tetratricopeptide (TPR) repeat protein